MKGKVMILIRLLMTVSFLAAGCARTVPATQPARMEPAISVALREANEYFTYKGSPIHPGLVKEFEGRMSDDGPIVLTVDVLGSHGVDEYGAPFKIMGEKVSFINRNATPTEWYQYERLGTLANGIHVLHTSFNGGGSGIFQNLLFVRFDVQPARSFHDPAGERLVMSIVDWYPLGDRDNGKIQIMDDTVMVGPSRYRSNSILLRKK
jgi:hypothetical protein